MTSGKSIYRINVIGASGCGASTVGRLLAAQLNLPHFDSDDYYHGPSDPPFQNPRSPKERFEMVVRDMPPTSSWILSGGIVGWNPYPELDFTHVVLLYVPTEIRLERLRVREYNRFGHRILEGGDMYANHQEFLQWTARYDIGDVDGKTRQRHLEFLKAQTCPVFEVRGDAPVDEVVARVKSQLAAVT